MSSAPELIARKARDERQVSLGEHRGGTDVEDVHWSLSQDRRGEAMRTATMRAGARGTRA